MLLLLLGVVLCVQALPLYRTVVQELPSLSDSEPASGLANLLASQMCNSSRSNSVAISQGYRREECASVCECNYLIVMMTLEE
jgi:hypothetical protein